ncbi:MAG: sigma-70 family RNA polymerase sigma factor [Bryobacteraceae bacterium]
MVSEWSDQELGQQIGLGRDEAAEAELARRMGPRIRLYGMRHLRDESAADDLVQQVLITTLQALREGRLREVSRLTSFVLGTSRMTVLDWRRNARRKEELLNLYGPGLTAPVAEAGPSLDHAQLARCVERLKERERAVVMMTFFEEEDGAGVAQFLGVSEANVRVIRHRAIHQLRGCMGVAA